MLKTGDLATEYVVLSICAYCMYVLLGSMYHEVWREADGVRFRIEPGKIITAYALGIIIVPAMIGHCTAAGDMRLMLAWLMLWIACIHILPPYPRGAS